MSHTTRSAKNPKQFSLSEQLVFYGSYHSHPMNLAAHVIFVPLIAWSMQVLLAMIPVPAVIKNLGYTYVFNDYLKFTPNWAAFQTAYLVIYYSILDPFASLTLLPSLSFMLLTATSFSQRPHAAVIANVLNVVSWVAQVMAHKFAEKRAPALTDNLAAAFILAPFFLHLEGLFALGYKRDLHRKVQKEINAELKRYHEAYTDRDVKIKAID